MLTRFAKWFGLQTKDAPTGPTGPLNRSWEVVFGNQRHTSAETIFARMTDAERECMYQKHAMVFACIDKVCSSFHAAPLRLGKMVENEFESEKVVDLSIMDVLSEPSAWYSKAELMEAHLQHLLLTGKSYIWKWRNVLGEVAELWPVPTSWVKPVPLKEINRSAKGRDRILSHYEFRAPGMHKQLPIKVTDMVYTRKVSPDSMIDGTGPMQAAENDVHLDREREEYMAEMLENMKSPGMIIRQKQEFTKYEREEIKAALEENAGRGKRGSPLLLYGEGAGVDMLVPLKDLDWPGLSSMAESHICAAFGVPPLLVHARSAQENTPLSTPNLEAAEKVFYRSTILSLWMHTAQSLTRDLLTVEGAADDLLFEFDTSKVRALQQDEKETAETVEIGIRSGVMKINEGRQRLGLPVDEDLKGMYLIPMNMTHYKPGDEETLDVADNSEPWQEEEEIDDGASGEGGEDNVDDAGGGSDDGGDTGGVSGDE